MLQVLLAYLMTEIILQLRTQKHSSPWRTCGGGLGYLLRCGLFHDRRCRKPTHSTLSQDAGNHYSAPRIGSDLPEKCHLNVKNSQKLAI